MKALDDKDREILAILSKEARTPMKSLAARIGLSRSATTERVSGLERRGIIQGYRAIIGEVDQHILSAYMLITLNETPANDVVDAMAHYPEVRRICSLSGRLDMIVEVDVASVAELNSLRDYIAALPKVSELTTHIILNRDIDRLG